MFAYSVDLSKKKIANIFKKKRVKTLTHTAS